MSGLLWLLQLGVCGTVSVALLVVSPLSLCREPLLSMELCRQLCLLRLLLLELLLLKLVVPLLLSELVKASRLSRHGCLLLLLLLLPQLCLLPGCLLFCALLRRKLRLLVLLLLPLCLLGCPPLRCLLLVGLACVLRCLLSSPARPALCL